MRHIRVTDPRATELIEAIIADGRSVPVRAVEAVLARGEAGFGMLICGLRTSLDSRRPARAHWCAVGLGECRDPDGAPELTMLLRLASRGRCIGLGFAAAEALGKMGAAAERALLENARLTQRHERYWFHYAAARMATDGASAFLLDELEHNLQLADSAALALADVGCANALPAIDRRLKRLKPWQSVVVEQAVLALHRGEPVLGRYTEDWRLRYRHSPGFGVFPPLWPCLIAIVRTNRRCRTAAEDSAPARSVDEILARAKPRQHKAEPCGVCGTGRGQPHTGVVVCDACAPNVARVQADCLLGVDCTSDDLFDVLNTIDGHLLQHDTGGLPPDDKYRRYLLARDACHWLVEQRIEKTAAGAAALLVEACTCTGACTCDASGPD